MGGNRVYSIINWTGPTSYTAVTAGTPPASPTGGQSIDASQFGLKYIEKIIGGLDQSGKYLVVGTGGNGIANDSTVGTIQWITAATGAEVVGAVNLSTYTVRLMAIGR